MQPVAPRARIHPGMVAPWMRRGGCDTRRGTRALLIPSPIGVGLKEHFARGPAADLVFVERALRDTGNKQFPNPARATHRHRMRSTVPAVEIAHHAYPLRVRRPYREATAGHALALGQMSAKRAPSLVQTAGVEQEQIMIRNLGGKRVRIERLARDAAFPEAHTPWCGRRNTVIQLKQSRRAWCERCPASRRFNPRLLGHRVVYPDHPTLAIAMRAQNMEWIVKTCLKQQLERRTG